MTINVKGMLKQPDKILNKLFVDEEGIEISAGEARLYLFAKLDEGYLKLPMNGVECEGFCKINGCPGHVAG